MAIAVSPVSADLSTVLRQGRAELGGGDATRFPQPRMAELLGVSLRQYQRWERGVSMPRARDAARIRATLARPAHEPTLRAELAELRSQVDALRAELDLLRERL